MFMIDPMSRQPVYEQIIRQMERFILSGMLAPGDQLPSVRSLSLELSINPNTIQRAYAELERRGYIYTVKGKGSFVGENSSMKEIRKNDILSRFSEVIDDAIRLGISDREIKTMIDVQYNAAKAKGGNV